MILAWIDVGSWSQDFLEDRCSDTFYGLGWSKLLARRQSDHPNLFNYVYTSDSYSNERGCSLTQLTWSLQ